MSMQSDPFHSGEIEAQARAGEARSAQRNSAALGGNIPGGALQFVRQQQIAVLAREGPDGHLWCSVAFGPKEFLESSDDGKQLTVKTCLSSRTNEDPVWQTFEPGEQVGVLLIELATRRRLKVNGVATLTDTKLIVAVTESFPLCPKYIQRRAVRFDGSTAAGPNVTTGFGQQLGAEQRQTISSADTFFVASTHEERGPDASHRGGLPGFIEFLPDNSIRIPDYPGNSMFNTFGNLLLDSRAGLVFVDFKRRVLLQLTGEAEVFWDQSDAGGDTGGTKRLWHFRCHCWQESSLPSEVRGDLIEYSPFNPSPRK